MHEDWLMRQIERFAVGVAEMLVDGVVDEDEDIEEQCEALLGAPLEHFEAMSPHSLLSLFFAPDAQTVRRALALAVGLARRGAEHGDPASAAAARRRSLALLDGMTAAGRTLPPDLLALRESLVRRLGHDPELH
jgi:hypothetical protein